MATDELSAEHPRVLKIEGKQIALFRLGSEEIHAIDNRCPHEGYPLSTGALKDGVLTCEWHNWKFRLCDGVCVLGGENVRRYPVRVDDGAIWLDLVDAPAAEQRPALYHSLLDAFEEGDFGQASRAIERLLATGEDAASILGHGCDWAARHAPYGFDHGLAAAADLAAMLDDFGAAPGLPVLEALSLMVEPNLRRPERALGEAEASSPETPGAWSEVERVLRQRIESEDVAGAEALLRGALARGAGPAQVFPWLTHAATDHFLDYGHSHIYCVKAEELLAIIGWQHAHPVLTSLVSQIAYGTREDRLPYMRSYARELARHVEDPAQWSRWAGHDARAAQAPDVDAVLHAVLDGDLGAALAAVAAELDRGVAAPRVALVLALAAAHRLMRFDPDLEHRDDVAEGWLSVTHALTHADAVHQSLVRYPSALVLRGLFHSARFIQHLAPCDLPAAQRPVVVEQAPEPEADDLGLLRSLRAHDAAGAMAAMRRGLDRGAGGNASVEGVLRGYVATDSSTQPIFVAHHIKMAMAGQRLARALYADPVLGQRTDRDLPAVAAVRFIAHPLRERRIARQARVARDFVLEGKRQPNLRGY